MCEWLGEEIGPVIILSSTCPSRRILPSLTHKRYRLLNPDEIPAQQWQAYLSWSRCCVRVIVPHRTLNVWHWGICNYWNFNCVVDTACCMKQHLRSRSCFCFLADGSDIQYMLKRTKSFFSPSCHRLILLDNVSIIWKSTALDYISKHDKDAAHLGLHANDIDACPNLLNTSESQRSEGEIRKCSNTDLLYANLCV